MLRWLIVLTGALALVALAPTPTWAAAETELNWVALGEPFARGSGGYFNLWKLLGLWLLFLLWVRTTDWVSQDAQQLKLRYYLWNAVVFFTFFLGLILSFVVPYFAVGFSLMALFYAVPLAVYIVQRNKKVRSPSDKVLTRKHMRRWMARRVSLVGLKMAGGDDDPRDAGPQVNFKAQGAASEQDNQANLIKARQMPGLLPARELIDDAVRQRGTHVMLDYAAATVGVRYQVDGVWHDRTALERENGDALLEVFKSLANLKVADRRSRQSGTFGVEVGKDKLTAKITSQGTQTGERVLVQLLNTKVAFKTLDDLGMRSKQQEQLVEVMGRPGLVVFCAIPANGLTSTIDTTLSNLDRFTRNFVEVSDVAKPEHEVENVQITTYSSAEGETPATILPKLIRTYPDVIIVRDVTDLETLSILCEQPEGKRLAVTSVRAKEAVEALLRLMMLKVPPAEFIPAVTGVLNVRLIRKLCEKCKEAYPPPAEVLKQLGLPAGRIESLFRPPTQPLDPKHPDAVCEACLGIGYLGRTAIFELLTVDDNIRNVLSTAPKLENLRAIARKSKHRSLQDEGVLLVARGVTSLQELLRVLKQ